MSLQGYIIQRRVVCCPEVGVGITRVLASKHRRGRCVMITVVRWVLVLAMLVAAAPAYSGEAVQMFRCEQEAGASEEDIMALAQEWLSAAQKTKGGEGMRVQVLFPIAVNATNEIDFLFLVSAPSFEKWGVFWDNYSGSPASQVDKGMNEKAICPDSALWEVERIEAKAK
jgi:hypothetical protein